MNHPVIKKAQNLNVDIINEIDILANSSPKAKVIGVTGTNGKSTTCQLLYQILLNQKYDVKLVGNIGNPILSSNKIKRKTIFVVEASSYQLEYSKIFKSKYAVILNISPDHIERHKSLNNYVDAKFKLLKSQIRGSFAYVKKDDEIIKKKIIKVNADIETVNKVSKRATTKFLVSESN